MFRRVARLLKERKMGMNYISAKEISEKWNISDVLVRKYCRQHRIPGVKFENGSWLIPENAKKPKKIVTRALPPMPPLAKKLVYQKTKKGFHGLYDYIQIYFTYSSCRLASNRLTRQQVEDIYRKGKIRTLFEPTKVSDMVEAMNHCVCINYILDCVNEPLTQKIIMQLHYMLMFGTVDHRNKQVTPGVYRTEGLLKRNRPMPPADQIIPSLKKLIQEYESLREVGMTEILDFHVRFEQIIPFEDGNGRIGRLIMFKECLRHDVTPFIIDDKRRTQYLAGLLEWPSSRMTLMEVAAAAQERFAAQISFQELGETPRCDYRGITFDENGEDYNMKEKL